ncbi:MAG TPA: ADP-ribosylglycohydrolase family protein, partial [Polyangiaceae bacterium LLY-WYZ-15_(1-7)]|nr:ADP-ribosylglycohydrolase family protein [Polyangiaceae bacterium LLY-WYZ-15_(1-7)]
FEGASSGERLDGAVAARLLRPRAWSHSDDGEMMLGVMRALEEGGRIEEARLLEVLARGHEPARGYGKGTRAAFRAWTAGASWQEAGQAAWPEGSRGNGGAVRGAPVVVWTLRGPEERAVEAARAACRATHAHAEALDGAVAVALATRRELSGRPWSLEELAERAPALAGPLREAEACQSPAELLRRVGAGVLAAESVPAALWLARRADSFEAAAREAIRLGGDTDSIGAMVGGVVGARVGAAAIPAPWRAALEPGAERRVEAFLARAIARTG